MSRGSPGVFDLPMLTEEEREQLLVVWNDTERVFPESGFIHTLFEECAARSPGEVAVLFEDESLSYAALNAKANRLAGRLRDLGVKPDDPVCICMDRSSEMIVGLLAILKAGCVYVPMDPDYPRERLTFMLEDAGARVLLTQAHRASLFDGFPIRVLVPPDLFRAESDPEATANLDLILHPENAAYMIYTSGTTGKPKGTLNSHRAIANRLIWMRDLSLTASDRFLQKTPFCFDVSVWEIFFPLTIGARLVVAEPGKQGDPEYLCRTIQAHEITAVHFVPSMLWSFLEEPRSADCRSLRNVFCSGEALSPPLMAGFFEKLGSVALHNLYGPTEAAVEVTYWQCQRGKYPGTVPIGGPIANVRIFLLDRYGNPTPAGVPGELHIGGICLARGYRNRHRLTAEKFVPNPFSKTPGGRLYKTGDAGRYLADGQIAFLGRLDHQVKVRGFRIELGEIETHLRGHEAVSEAVVLSRGDGGDTRLVGFVHVSGPQNERMAGALKAYLATRLPHYMVPAILVVLKDLPLMPNGKIDRKALDRYILDREILAEEPYRPPETPTEIKLAEIWSELLRIERIGVHDDFFMLGGHSLLITRVLSRIEHVFSVKARVVDLFKLRTLSSLADHIDNYRKAVATSRLLPENLREDEEEFEL